MKSTILGMLAETSIHPGSGSSAGAIDLPVAREAATDYPVVVGSSLKGALRDSAGSRNLDADTIFGKQEHAGNLLVSDARLLLLPVRSLNSTYVWATCPHLLERLKRDMVRSGYQVGFDVPEVGVKEALAAAGDKLFLEERTFTRTVAPDAALLDVLKGLIPFEETKARLEPQLVVLSNKDFSWFSRYSLAVQARNKLDENKTTVSGALWYEESLPADTLFYAVLAGRQPETLEAVKESFSTPPYLQVGGNETVGQGWFSLHWLEG